MDNRRQDLLRQLEATVDKTLPVAGDFSSLSFQIMYGLPTELQFRAACHMCERYLPIYETKRPGSTWPRQLLGDIDAWFRVHGEDTPDGPDDIDTADSTYQSRFTNLLCAYRYKDDPACLTAGICATIFGMIHARARNVFLADDPVVVRLEKEKEVWWNTWGSVEEDERPAQPESMSELWQPEHSAYDNVAFIAVYRREWLHVIEWLRAEAVWTYPEPDDLDAMMRGLKRWEGQEFYMMWPESRVLPDLSDEFT